MSKKRIAIIRALVVFGLLLVMYAVVGFWGLAVKPGVSRTLWFAVLAFLFLVPAWFAALEYFRWLILPVSLGVGGVFVIAGTVFYGLGPAAWPLAATIGLIMPAVIVGVGIAVRRQPRT